MTSLSRPLPRRQLQVLEVELPKTPIDEGFDPDKFELGRFKDETILICRETFLPAYKSSAEFEARKKRFFPGLSTLKFWRCVHCGYWHNKSGTVDSNGQPRAECDKSILTKQSDWDTVKSKIPGNRKHLKIQAERTML